MYMHIHMDEVIYVDHGFHFFCFIGDRNDQQGIFTIMGCMYGATVFAGINNCQLVMPFVSIERSVVYRERFAGMYSLWAYSLAQVSQILNYICKGPNCTTSTVSHYKTF